MPSNIFEEVQSKSNISDIITSYGINISNNKCLCPFHNDHNASMSIDKKRNIVKCFSCGEGGNVISFIQKYEQKVNNNANFTSYDAVRKAIEICNLPISVSNIPVYEDRQTRGFNEHQKQLLEANKVLEKYFNYLLSTSAGKDANEYFRKRGITDNIIKEMNLGVSYETTRYIQSRFTDFDTRKLGIDNRFENRIIFPIADARGNVVAFCGRTMTDEQPKYLLIKENDIFHKSDLLFNFDKAQNDARNQDEIILVEGFMDVIGAKKMGMNNTVALMGTAITDSHISLLKKMNCEITLALDNDEAGKRAMLNQIPVLLQNGFDVNVIDISKIDGNNKDFGDVGNTGATKQDVIKFKQSALSFMLENKYLDAEFSVSNINKAYNNMISDGLIKNSLDNEIFIETIQNNTDNFTKEQLKNIILPTENNQIVENELSTIQKIQKDFFENMFYNNVEKSFDKSSKLEKEYFEKNKNKVKQNCLNEFYSFSRKYFSQNTRRIDYIFLREVVMNKDNEYKEYYKNHYFPFENIFDNAFLVDKHGGINKINLNEEQKGEIVKNYNEHCPTFPDTHFEELYLVGTYHKIDDDIKSIIPADLLNDDMSDELYDMMMNNETPAEYNFENSLGTEKLNIVDSKFKTADGKQYKSLMMIPNEQNRLNITKENLMLETPKEKEKQIIKDVITLGIDKSQVSFDGNFAKIHANVNNTDGYIKVNKNNLSEEADKYVFNTKKEYTYSFYSNQDKWMKKLFVPTIQKILENNPVKAPTEKAEVDKFRFSVNGGLISKETDKAYFVRIPNTNATKYMYLAKSNCKWIDDNTMFFTNIDKNSNYRIYDKNGTYQHDELGTDISSYWEDKTKQPIIKNDVPEMEGR